jgi:hypothetical protein
MKWNSGFRLQASGFRLQASGFRLQASGFNGKIVFHTHYNHTKCPEYPTTF